MNNRFFCGIFRFFKRVWNTELVDVWEKCVFGLLFCEGIPYEF